MEQQWRIRIHEKQRKEPDKHLLLQALIALIQQGRSNATEETETAPRQEETQ